jgi:hypothetical protein
LRLLSLALPCLASTREDPRASYAPGIDQEEPSASTDVGGAKLGRVDGRIAAGLVPKTR